ncbi:MAG: sigma factor-like helix-turn-helix DNA-binding protein [Marmoricola sp.]
MDSDLLDPDDHTRQSRERVRSAQARTNREEKYHRQTTPSDRARPDVTHDLVHASFEATRVHSALAELSAVQRQALELAYFGGFTHPEVAARIGVPLGTAKTPIRTGLLRLHDLLGDP